jgi:hypothetical protein
LSEDLRSIERFFPPALLPGGNAVTEMNWGWFGILVGCAVIFTWLSLWLFERRDIRVSGESGWRTSRLFGHKLKYTVESEGS